MKFLCSFVIAAAVFELATPAPADGFVFPSEKRRDKKLDPIITPPVLPVLEHLERDPSTLLPNETKPVTRRGSASSEQGPVRPRFGGFGKPQFGGGFSLSPSGNGGLTGSISSSASGGGASNSASQSFSFGFNQGFSASHSASQSASFSSNGFGRLVNSNRTTYWIVKAINRFDSKLVYFIICPYNNSFYYYFTFDIS